MMADPVTENEPKPLFLMAFELMLTFPSDAPFSGR